MTTRGGVFLGLTVRTTGSHAIEHRRVDYDWRFHCDPVRPWPYLPRLRILDVEPVGARVGLLREDAMHVRGGEWLAAEPDAFGI